MDDERPTCRSQCVDGPRPCPWVSCRYNLTIDIIKGRVRVNPPGEDSCALDVADRGEHSVAEIAAILGISKQRVSFIEQEALAFLRGEQPKRHRGHAPYGWRVVDGLLEKDPDEQRVIRRVRSLRAAGHTWMSVASTLNAAGIRNRNGNEWNQNSARRAPGGMQR